MAGVPTFCRICESQCGLLATVEGDDLRLAPDPEHPVSKGYACRKGTRFAEIHAHPDRVLRPLLRRDDTLAPVAWDAALADVGGRLRAIRDAHGPESIGLFLGNAAASSLPALVGTQLFQRAVGTRKSYSSLTLDNSPMFVVTEACLGDPMTTFVADYAGSDLVVLFGTDPLASQPSQVQSNPGGVGELQRAGREGRLIVVDPRVSVTARAGSHIPVRPGADLDLLAWLVREALARSPTDALLDPADLAGLAEAVAPFSRERAERSAGADLGPLIARLFGAKRPLVWSGLGVLLGPDGTLGYWLTLALQALLGGIDREGGWLHPRGALDLAAIWRRFGPPGSDARLRSRVGGYPAVLGTLAAATMPDDILTPGDGRLRALVVVAGNPALSLPDTTRARAALSSLDLLVSLDLFVNETGTLAHAVLPATDWLERDEVSLQLASARRVPHLQRARAVVPPRGEARSDHDILVALGEAAGLPLSRLGRWVTPERVASTAVAAFTPWSWRGLSDAPLGKVADHAVLGGFRARGRRIRLAVPEFAAALAEHARTEPEGGFRLVSSVRPITRMNTWIGRSPAVATLHPDDLAALGDPARVRVRGPAGSVEVDVVADPGQARGVVVLPWGDPARSANTLVGSIRLERFTGQPRSNGERVTVEAAFPAGNEATESGISLMK